MDGIQNVPGYVLPINEIGRNMKAARDYNKAKQYLFCLLLSGDKEFPDGVIVRRWMDFLIVPEVFVHWEKTGITTLAVTESLCEEWGVSPETVLREAAENSPKLLPYKKTHATVAGERVMRLTNRIGVFGGGAILYPDMQKRIRKEMGTGCICMPSSIHGWDIFPEGMLSARQAEEILAEQNKDACTDSVLGNRVYSGSDLERNPVHII